MISKLIIPENFNFDCATATLLRTFSKGFDSNQFTKTAALFDDRIKEIVPREDRAYVHLITTGAQEYYGPNNNGDAFNEGAKKVIFPDPRKGVEKVAMLRGGLTEFHDKTFTKEGGLYKNHQNRTKGGKPSGEIVFAGYNPRMHRGELIVAHDVNVWKPELEKLAAGKPVYYSMGCSVNYDICSYCGNKASKRSEYCDHLKHNMLAMDKEGNQVFAWNDAPIFHDISGVFRPADKISFGLRKVASLNAVSGAELAEMFGLVPPVSLIERTLNKKASDRYALLKKIAEIEKEIELAPADSPKKSIILAFKKGSGFGECPDNVVNTLSNADLGDVFEGLAHKKTLLPMETLFKMVMGDRYSEVEPHIEDAKSCMPGIFNKLIGDENIGSLLEDGSYEPSGFLTDKGVLRNIDDLVGSCSLEPEPVKRRIIRITIVAPPEALGDMMPKVGSQKTSPIGEYLAREYAKYQLAFLNKTADDYTITLTLASNLANVY